MVWFGPPKSALCHLPAECVARVLGPCARAGRGPPVSAGPETARRCLTPLSAVPFSLVPVVPSSVRPVQQILGVFEFVATWIPWCMLTQDTPSSS